MTIWPLWLMGPRGVEEAPEPVGDIVLGGWLEVGDLGAGHGSLGGVVAHLAGLVDGAGGELADAVRLRVVAPAGIGDRLGSDCVGGGVGVVGVAGDGDVGGVAVDEGVIANLHLAGDKLDGEQAVGDEEGGCWGRRWGC